MRIILIGLSIACAAFAQEGVVAGPSLGLLYDPAAHTLHSVNGVAAAALLSESLSTADGLAWLEAAPGGAFALGLSQETGQVELLTASGRRALDSLPAGARGVRFSPAGRAAMLLFEDRALVLTSLAAEPSVAWEFAAGANAMLALSDDGSQALSLVEGRLVQYNADGSANELLATGARAAAFAEGSHDSVILTDEAGVLLLNHNGEMARLLLPEGLAAPMAAAATQDYILLAAEDGAVTKLSRDGATVETISCGCKPTTLARVGRSLLYRLNDPGDGPVWLLDAAEGQPRILFIPPVVKEAE
ncbi:MAG: hypothetical protein ABI972_22870 [Acidobacteriota bacterium]